MIAANPKVVCRRLSNLINDKAMERTASSMSRPLNRRSGGAGECDGDGDAEIGVCVCATAACNGSAEICRQRGDVMIHLLLPSGKLFDCLPRDDIRRWLLHLLQRRFGGIFGGSFRRRRDHPSGCADR